MPAEREKNTADLKAQVDAEIAELGAAIRQAEIFGDPRDDLVSLKARKSLAEKLRFALADFLFWESVDGVDPASLEAKSPTN